MDTYLSNNKSPRSLVKGLSSFKHLTLSKTSKKGKAPEAGPPVGMSSDLSHLEGFLDAVGWTSDDFAREYNLAYKLMEKECGRFPREDRLSSHLGTRLMAMCAITWNHKSRNRSRDWPVVAAAVTVEMALVQHYREPLLTACFGAQALRSDLHSLFSDVTLPHAKLAKHDAVSGKKVLNTDRTWEFADGLSIQLGESEPRLYDLQIITEERDAAHPEFVKGKKDTILGMIQYLEKSKLLAASQPQAKSGSIETLAHHFITGLAEVGLQSIVVSVSSQYFQIMYKNQARLEHEKAAKLGSEESVADFDMDSVDIPSVPRRHHVVSDKYHPNVSTETADRCLFTDLA